MLKPIENILNNPNDLPDVPRAVKEYLQSRYNADFLYQSEVRKLREAGHSEEFVSGVLYGHYMASRVLDEMEGRQRALKEGD